MRRLARLCCLLLALLISPAVAQIDPAADHLPDTAPLELNEPLDVVMVRGINYFAERELSDSPHRRPEKWHRDYSSVEAYEASVTENRERLRTIIGAVDERVDSVIRFTWVDSPATAWNDSVQSIEFSLDVVEGVTVTGQWLSETEENPLTSKAIAIVVPDADQTPETLAGLTDGLPSENQLALRLADHDVNNFTISMINRQDTFSGHPDIRYTNLPHREFVYRMAFEMGRHIVGYEVQKVLAIVDMITSDRLAANSALSEIAPTPTGPTIVVGIGEGGLIAMLAAAIDPRIDMCVVSGYFGERENVWQEPIYRNIWQQLTEFSDADIASLIAPRRFVIEAAPTPEVDGPPVPSEGRSNSAAPGRIVTPDIDAVRREFAEAKVHYERLDAAQRISLVESGDHLPAGNKLLKDMLRGSEIEFKPPRSVESSEGLAEYDAARQQRQFNELVRYTQRLMHSSDKEREKFWSNADRSSVDAWVESAEWYRNYVHEEMIGKLSEPTMPPNPRSRKVIDEPTHVGYEVVLDCYPAGGEERPIPDGADTSIPDTGSVDNTGWAVGQDWGVIAGGILLLPKDLMEGEQRPVVVCQHGLEGTPMATITTNQEERAWRAYKGFSTELVKRGFIVYAPQNPYRGHDAFRVIQRKSNPMGRSLYSYIIEQHRRTLDWLASLPYVDPERIGFYGLSYGGKTAVRVPPMLPPTEDHPGYCLSICSADFNEWVLKNVSSEDRYSYIFTGEYEMFEWNLGHVANYAELSSLMTPRPFMVERGHNDGVAPDEWVAWEYAKVRRHYDQLGIGDLTEIEFFNGPHTINGQGTFAFLHRHLNWPAP